jgi:hypothetical protein
LLCLKFAPKNFSTDSFSHQAPVYTLIETPATPSFRSRSYLTDDPALVILYKQLREKTQQTLRGASKITPSQEWDFILQTARLYDRMGCDLLAVDLVRNWEFLKPAPPSIPSGPGSGLGSVFRNDGLLSPGSPAGASYGLEASRSRTSLLARRASLVVADLPSPTFSVVAGMQTGFESGEQRAAEIDKESANKKKQQPPPTTFVEPDATSLLDSFGF